MRKNISTDLSSTLALNLVFKSASLKIVKKAQVFKFHAARFFSGVEIDDRMFSECSVHINAYEARKSFHSL